MVSEAVPLEPAALEEAEVPSVDLAAALEEAGAVPLELAVLEEAVPLEVLAAAEAVQKAAVLVPEVAEAALQEVQEALQEVLKPAVQAAYKYKKAKADTTDLSDISRNTNYWLPTYKTYH